jgi:hypothetical protein
MIYIDPEDPKIEEELAIELDPAVILYALRRILDVPEADSIIRHAAKLMRKIRQLETENTDLPRTRHFP